MVCGSPRLVMFDADDGTQANFQADDIRWTSQDTHGDGNRPCVEQPEARVDVGVMRVADPDGGWHQEVVASKIFGPHRDVLVASINSS